MSKGYRALRLQDNSISQQARLAVVWDSGAGTSSWPVIVADLIETCMALP